MSARMLFEHDDVIFETVNEAGIITLNRPKALNALSASIVVKMLTKQLQWQRTKSLVIIKSAVDNVFCAGGDVKTVFDMNKHEGMAYNEYNICYLTGIYKIPYVSLLDGITMGGGLGIVANGRYRVATERTVAAMPETRIGIVPDVSGTYFLPRLKNKVGFYMGLTGMRLKGKDVVLCGLATHFVSSKNLGELEKQLVVCNNDEEVSSVLQRFHEPVAEQFSLARHLRDIEHCFSADTVEQIIARLEGVGNDWSSKTLKTLKTLSPTALKLSLKAFQRGSQLTLQECLRWEFRMVSRCLEYGDFKEGVRALLVDKDKPRWSPATLAEVSDDYIESFFKRLPDKQELYFFNSKI